jgi:hypothetical protein
VPVGGDPIQHACETVHDYLAFNALSWPAWDRYGQQNVPPPEHVLDHLARSHDLAPEDEISIRPPARTVFVRADLPGCDLCLTPGARYDAQVLDDQGLKTRYGFLCNGCYFERGQERLELQETYT